MQLTTFLTVLAVAATANAAVLSSRANPKVNEYPRYHCINHDGFNHPTWHHAPAMGKCVSIDKSTFSAYVTAQPGQHAVFYSDFKYWGRFKENKGGEDCVLLSQPELKIASIRMEPFFGC